MQDIKRLITHSGSFHADDVFSYSILSYLFPKAQLVRTRDRTILENPEPGDIIFDVGMQFNPDRNLFDHHQPDAPMRDGYHPYSSIGLVWAKFGRSYLEALGHPKEAVEPIWQRIDETVILPIDCGDNGVIPLEAKTDDGPLGLASLIEDHGPAFDDMNHTYDTEFLKAANFAQVILVNKADKAAAYGRARRIVEKALEEADDPRYLVLEQNCPWEAHVRNMGANELLYAIYPSNGEWGISAVKVAPGSFENKLDFPSEWGGLRDEALETASGVKGAVFCHTKLFFCAARTKEACLELVRLSLDNRHLPQP